MIMRTCRVSVIFVLALLVLGGCARLQKPVSGPVPDRVIDLDTAVVAMDSILVPDTVGKADSIILPDTVAAVDTVPVTRPREEKGSRKCILDFRASDAAHPPRLNMNTLPSGKSNAFVGGRTVWNCRGEDVTLVADSAEYYGDLDELHMIGNVRYKERRAQIDAQRMTYWTNDGRLLAENDVFAITENQATLTGQVAEYFRAVEGVREHPRIVATRRPLLSMPQKDTVTGEVKDTIHLLADRVESVNDSLVYAFGEVEITRTDLLATSDSAFLDEGVGRAQLIGNPVVNARDEERPFTLKGDIIDIFSTDKEVDRIVAAPRGYASSEDLELFSDTIDMRVSERKLERLMAWGPSRARAESVDQTIIADSIEAILPDQRIQELRAVRNAHATVIPDTGVITTTERDWMSGDTITALFDTVTVEEGRDSTGSPPVKSIRASIDARAYYHTKNNSGDKSMPGINYIRGRVITLDFANKEVENVTVLDRASGVYLEPLPADTLTPDLRRPAESDSVGTQPVTPPSDTTESVKGIKSIRKPFNRKRGTP